MNDYLTLHWVQSAIGKMAFSRRLLVWNSFRYHLGENVKELLAGKIDQLIVPGGCTKYIQAPDVCWNHPFKEAVTGRYDRGWKMESILSLKVETCMHLAQEN